LNFKIILWRIGVGDAVLSFTYSVRVLCLLLLAVLLISQFSLLPIYAQQEGQVSFAPISSFFKEGDGNMRIQNHVKYLSSLGSRVTGYPGFFKAADYIKNYLEEVGVEPFGDEGFYEYYYITVPIDWGANITLKDGKVLEAYMCWPNFVNTNSYTSPPEGDKVIYIGKVADIDNFDGKNISGKFVVMDFNSKWFFRFAIMLGAKGVIYTLGTETFRGESLSKFYNQPVRFPRYLLNKEDSIIMIDYINKSGGEATIWIESKMTWERVLVPNIVGLIEGSDPNLKNEYVLLCAHYDSMCVFPAISPGATDSLGVSALLELSRFLIKNRPKRSTIVLFTSGYYQSLWGAREYVEKHFDEVGLKIKLFISVDLSYGSNQLAVVNRGSTYGYNILESLNAKYLPLVSKIFQEYLPGLKAIFGEDYGDFFVDGIFLTYPYFIRYSPPLTPSLRFDSEPFTLAAFGGGLSFTTVNDFRLYQLTPLDTYDRVLFDNVFPQVYLIAGVAYGLLNEQDLPLSAKRASRLRTEWGYLTLNITVCTYNITTDFFDPFTKEKDPEVWKDLIVHFRGFSPIRAGAIMSEGIREFVPPIYALDVLIKPDERGTVTIKGVKPFTEGHVNAFAVNSTDGSVYWATDLGSFGAWKVGGTQVVVRSSKINKLVPIFECGSIVLMDVLNPKELTSTLRPTVYNLYAHAPMIHWGQSPSYPSPYTEGSPTFADYTFFVEIGTPAEIIFHYGETTTVWCAIANFTQEGKSCGYVITRRGESIVIKYPSLEYARQLFLLNNARVSTAAKYGVSNPMIKLYHGLAEKYLEDSIKMLNCLNYSSMYGYSFAAWAYEQIAYAETFKLIQDSILTITFFFLLTLPFAYIMERLLFALSGLKRVLFYILISALCMLFLYFYHPGFHLATNLLMVLIGFSSLIIIIPVIGFILSETSSSIKSLSSKILGIHTLESSNRVVLSTMFSLGISWMKKRLFRSVLVLTSITIVVFSIMTFTSFSSIAVPRPISRTNVLVSRNGILVRHRPWQPIPAELWLQLREELEGVAYVAPRAWYYPPTSTAAKGFICWNFQNATAKVFGILALSSEEQKISGIWDHIKVRGRWFYPDETHSVIISTALASNLTRDLGRQIKPGSQISIWGVNLTVVGLFDGNSLYTGSGYGPESGLIDLDGEPLTPQDPLVGGAVPPHLSGDEVIIVPFDLLWELFVSPPQLMSIAIKPINESDIGQLASQLAYRLDVLVIYGITKGKSIEGWPIGDVVQLTTRSWYSIVGAENLIIPSIIASLTILNMMLGAIYERVRSILVYVVVGSTPTQLTEIFLCECLVYGIISVFIGYILGVLATSTLISLGIYPSEFFPNFTSSFILVIASLSLAMPLLSTIYPALKAWRLVTPSLERKWKMPEPLGDHWTIPLPFTFTTEKELLGVLYFIKEYLESYSGAGQHGLFTVEKINLGKYAENGRTIKRLSAVIRLAPYELAIIENMNLDAVPQKNTNTYRLILYFNRISGITRNWITSNKVFIDTLRKQFLIWRLLSPNDRKSYMEKAAYIETPELNLST